MFAVIATPTPDFAGHCPELHSFEATMSAHGRFLISKSDASRIIKNLIAAKQVVEPFGQWKGRTQIPGRAFFNSPCAHANRHSPSRPLPVERLCLRIDAESRCQMQAVAGVVFRETVFHDDIQETRLIRRRCSYEPCNRVCRHPPTRTIPLPRQLSRGWVFAELPSMTNFDRYVFHLPASHDGNASRRRLLAHLIIGI